MARITLRLPDELHRRLRVAAREAGRSLNEEIVTILTERLDGESERQDETPLQRERRRIREALGDLVVDFRPEDFAPFFHPLPDDFDRDAFFNSLPRLDPPLSQTIIEDREDRF
jgi:plasmid stability protein